jgi:hypothetical protein
MRARHSVPALLLATLAASVAFPSCVENRSSLFVLGVLALEAGDGCEVEVSETAAMWARGNYDPSLGRGYWVYLLLGNQLQELGDPETLRTETSRIQLEGAEVEVETLDGDAPERSAYTVAFAGLINPSQSNSPGLAAAPVELIPRGYITGEGEYVLRVTVFGTTLGNTPIESGEFAFTVNSVPLGGAICSEDDTLVEPACQLYGSDSFVDCRYYTGLGLAPPQCENCENL